MKPVILALPGNTDLTNILSAQLDVQLGQITVRRFLDGESYVRVDTPPSKTVRLSWCAP